MKGEEEDPRRLSVGRQQTYIDFTRNRSSANSYQCEVHGKTGLPNADYALAFASALEEGSLMSTQVDLTKVRVSVTGTYETQDKRRPVASGPIATKKASDSLTDLI